MTLLDTDVFSALRRPERHPRVAAWLMAQDERGLFVSAVTIGEIARRVALKAQRNPVAGAVFCDWLDGTCLQFANRIRPFDAEAARVWGRLSAEIGHDGADLQIAAIALVAGFTVATRNIRRHAPAGVAPADSLED